MREKMSINSVITIVIVDDHPVFRMGLRKIISQEKDMKIIGEAEDASQGFSLIQKVIPDVAIVDISLKDSNGLSLIHEVTRHFAKVKPLVLSMHDERVYAQRALQAGAFGYVMKNEAAEVIINALRTVARGKVYLSHSIMEDIVLKVAKKEYDVTPLHMLTEKELEILELIGKGRTTNEIAHLLNLSSKTVGTYKERIKEKLKLENAVQLVYFATKWVENPLFVGKKTTIK